MIHDLNEETFAIYAIRNYDTPNTIMSEFEEDIKRIKYIKRLLKRYRSDLCDDGSRERLILNHIIVLANVFGPEATTYLLFYRADEEDYPILKTFLLFLNYIPEAIKMTFNGKVLMMKDIPVSMEILKTLREIKTT